jgi:hypothetical protein
MSLITCPLPAEPETIPVADCYENFGQIQRFFIQREYNGLTKNVIAAADALLKATYVALKTATDSSKLLTPPIIGAPEHEPGGPRTFGGGNTTLNGVPLILGEEPSAFNCVLYRMKQIVIKAIKKLRNEPNLAVIVINEHGQFGMLADDPANPTSYSGIPIQAFFCGGKGFGNYEGVDSNAIQWQFKPDALDNFVVVTPTDVNPLTEL